MFLNCFRSFQQVMPSPIPGTWRESWLLAIALLISGLCANLRGTEPEVTVRKKASEGLEHFSSGRYSEAAQAFEQGVEKAQSNSTESAVLLFDQACALRAAGEIDRARELFLQVAIGDNKHLASESHYNLAAIAAEQGRQILGEDPLAAEAEKRQQAMERLQAAISHYRDSLRSDAQNADARHNMELVRLFINHLEEGWRERDLQQLRDKQDLFQFLKELDVQQSQLRERTRQFVARGPRVSRLERTKLAESQRKLLAEMVILNTKIATALQAESLDSTSANQNSAAAGQPQLSAEQQNAIQQLKQMIGDITGRAEQSIEAAADSVQSGKYAEALEKQQSTCDRFYETFIVMGPFQLVLQRAIDDQQSLIDQGTQPVDDRPAKRHGAANRDFDTMAWRQDWVTKSSHALLPKAAAMLQSIPTEPEAGQIQLGQELSTDSTSTESADLSTPDQPTPLQDATVTDPSSTDPSSRDVSNTERNAGDINGSQQTEEAAAETTAALRRALEKAIESSPVIVEHSKLANESLTQRALAAAEPEQREVLRLLKEIADLLPKQPPQDQQNQDQQNQDQQNQDQQSQKQQDQNDKQKQDPNQQDQNSGDQPKDPQSGDQQKSDQKTSPDQPPKQDEQSPSPKQQPPQEEKNSSQESQPDKNNQQPDQAKEKQSQTDDSKSDAKSGSTSPVDNEAAKEKAQQKLAEERAQVILRRIREREAKYRELLERLREIQGRRSPVEKDW